MVILKTKEETELVRISASLVAEALILMRNKVEVGITTAELNRIADRFAYDNGATPGFKGYRGFPFAICSSRDDEIVHGFPSNVPLADGTILSIDFGILKNGYYGDAAITFPIGDVSEAALNLIKITEECLYKGIEQAVPGNRVGDISYAIQSHGESNGYSVVKRFVGHGIGRNLHEAPQIPNFGRAGKGTLLKEGMIIAIEPMLTIGSADTKTMSDGWTVRTKDGGLAAHFEHTIAITKNGPEILSII